MDTEVSEIQVCRFASLAEALRIIDKSGPVGLALVVNSEGVLLDVLTDGDVRRALLHDLTVASLVHEALRLKERLPLTAPQDTPRSELLELMQKTGVRQVVLVDKLDRPVGVSLMRDLVPEIVSDLRAVVMAGGLGLRLRPLTDNVPKPMLPVEGNKPLLESTIERIREAGIGQVIVTTHHRAERITEHFGDGERFGIDISYVHEQNPMGTAGALRMIEPSGPVLVVNGDIYTGVDYAKIVRYHEEHGADLTVGVKSRDTEIPFGVVRTVGERVIGIDEKPTFRFVANAGIYVIAEKVLRECTAGKKTMPEVIQQALAEDRKVIAYPITEYWYDIGRLADYTAACTAATVGDL